MKNSGFSLLELSIVLVIIGLIAGGIVAGSSMIRAAELRAVATEFTQYQTAVNTFRDKYLGLPGDLKNAEQFWGTAHATDATCITTASTGIETCNGNGDGNMLFSTRSAEPYRFWQHLANAGLVSGAFNGASGANNVYYDADIGENIPESKLSGAGWHAYRHNSSGAYGGDTASFEGNFGNFFFYGGNQTTDLPTDTILTSTEAWSLDKKIDDGKPAQGNVWSYRWATCTDATNFSEITANYDLDDDSQACSLMFINAI